ncbi:MAG: polysaccharide biosynthesis C-terminal domain-containing protein, partial [Bacteroidota bacterium]
LSIDEIGTYEMLLYVGVSFSFFWINGLLQGLLPIYPNLEPTQQRQFFFNSYLLFCTFSLVVFGLLYFAEAPVLELLTGQPQLPYFRWYCYFLLLNLPTYLVEYIYLLRNEGPKIIGFGMLAFGGQVLAVVLPVFLAGDLELSFKCLLALAAVKHIWLWFLLLRYAKARINSALVREYIWVALPLMAYAFIAGFTQAFDQWLVNWFYDGDTSTFAIFRNGARELPLTVAVVAAFSATMIPLLAKDMTSGLAELKRKTIQLSHILFPISIVLLLTSHYFFPVVFNEDFADSVPIFNIYLLMVITRLSFPHSIIIAHKDTRYMLWVSIVENSFNVLLSIVLVQWYGLEGIAFATFVALLLEKLAYVWIVYRKYEIAPRVYTNVNVLLGYSLILFLTWVWVS